MNKQKRIKVEIYELLFKLMFLSTYTSFSIGRINISDKILLITITMLLFLKYIRYCVPFILINCFPYIVFIFFGLLGVVFLEPKARILFFDFNYIIQIILFSVFVFLFSMYNLNYERFLEIIYNISVFTGLVGILQYFFWGPVTRITSFFVEAVYDNPYMKTHRIGALYDNPNLFASMLACMSLVGLLFWFESNKKKYLFGSMIMVVALLFTETRSALLVFSIGVLHICFLKQEKKQRLKSFALVILFGIAVQYIISKGFLARFAVLFQESKNFDLITSKRNIIWNTLLLQGMKNLFYGIGNGMSEIVTDNIIGESYGPHSMYIGIISETGIIGAISFFVFLLMILMKGRKICDKKLKHIFFVIFIAMLLLQITESHLRAFMQFIILFWLVASIPFSKQNLQYRTL